MKTTRLSRLAKLGSLAANLAGSVAQSVASRATGVTDSVSETLHSSVAKVLFEKFGEMKGLPMKVGQILSYMDGVIPPEHQQTYRDALSKLQVKAKPMSWEVMGPEIEAELGVPLANVFSVVEHEPIAAASIGQVYKGVLLSGETVAIKIQYPGIADAIASDLKNAESVLGILRTIAPGLDTKQMAKDMLGRLAEETDYHLEATNQGLFFEAWKDNENVVIPKVFTSYTTKRLLVTKFEDGVSLDEFGKAASQEEKNAVAKLLFLFAFKSILKHGIFNADPHPGNYLVQQSGGVVFLDFGCVQAYSSEDRQALQSLFDAVRSGQDAAALWPTIETALAFEGKVSQKMKTLIVDYIVFCFKPAAAVQPFTFTKEYTLQIADLTFKLKAELAKSVFRSGWQEPKRSGLVHFNRIVFGLYSILAKLDATADWGELIRSLPKKG